MLRVNDLSILRTENAKFSGYYFYMNTNVKEVFKISVSVPLTQLQRRI